jgi:CheY-like chemotaxis protein
VANNGLEALEKIRKVSSLVQPRVGQPFDCVLMDLEMPGESLGSLFASAETKLTPGSDGWIDIAEAHSGRRSSRDFGPELGDCAE